MAVEVEGVAEVRSPTVSRDVNRARDETGAQGPPPRRAPVAGPGWAMARVACAGTSSKFSYID